jgi:hypothetical protein
MAENKIKQAIASALMVGGDSIAGIYGQRGNTYANYLDAQSKRQQMEAEAEKLRIESDPQIQAAKLASTMAMLGDSSAAERLMAFSQGKSSPIGQSPMTPPESTIPDYLGGNRPQINSQSIRPGVVAPIMGSGIGFGPKSMKVGNITLGSQKQTLNPIEQANLDIQKGLVSKKLEKQQDAQQSSEEQVTGTKRLFERFTESYDELKSKYPDIGASGTKGWIDRKGALIANAFDELPITKSFQTELPVLANAQAKLVEGGKVTDKDRDTYASAMVSALKHPTDTNVNLAANRLIDLADKGGDITKVLQELESSGHEISTKIAKKVYSKFPELKSKALGIPEGWEIVNE